MYEAGSITSSVATGTAYLNLWNLNATVILHVWEIAITNTGSTNTETVSLQRTSVRGTVTRTAPGEALDPGDPAATATLDSNWSTVPTVTGNYFRRSNGIINTGATTIWQWWGTREGVLIRPGTGLAVVNTTSVATDAAEGWYVWDE